MHWSIVARRRARLGHVSVAALLLAASTFLVPASGEAQSVGAGSDLPAGSQAQGLNVVGHTDLGGKGLNGEVAVVGTTAVVAAGYMPLGFVSQSNTSLASLNSAPPCPQV